MLSTSNPVHIGCHDCPLLLVSPGEGLCAAAVAATAAAERAGKWWLDQYEADQSASLKRQYTYFFKNLTFSLERVN